MKKKYILKNRKRFFSIIFTLTIILFTALFATNAYGYKAPTYKHITVKNGESLWSIALKYSNENDLRKYIYEIKKINQLETSDIYVGTQLKIPA
jgi:hypothetical protein